MAGPYEKLGIEIDVTLGQDAAQIVKRIETAFNNLNLEGLRQRLGSLEKQMKGAFHIDKNVMDELVKVTGMSVESLQKKMKETKISATVEKELKAMQKPWSDFVRQQEAGFKAAEKGAQSYAKYLEQIKSKQINMASGFMSGLNKQGLDMFNGQIIPKTYVKDLNTAYDLALKHNNSLKQQAEQMLTINGRQVKLNDTVQDYSNWLTGLNKQGKALWGNQIVSMKEYNEHLGKVNGSFGKWSANLVNLLGLEARFYGVRTVLFAISNQFRDAVTSVLDLNQAIHDTAAISGASVEQMSSLEKAALSIASSSKFTAIQVIETMKILAQAGVSTQDLPTTAKAATMFATGAGATPEQSVKLLTTSLNVFDLKAEQSMRVVNSLTAALNSSKLEAGGLGTAFNYLSNTAQIMGMSLEQTLGIISALSQKGLRDSTIGTGMSNLLGQLSAPKPRFQKLLSSKGIGLDEIDPTQNDFVAIVERLEKAGLKVNEIYGSLERQTARALIAALNVGSDGFRLFTESVTGTEAALVANMKAMDGVRGKMNVLKQEFVTSIDSISKAFGGMGEAGINALRDLALGVGSDGGKVVLGLTAVAGAMTAITAAVKNLDLITKFFSTSNPYILAATAALTAATIAVGAFGNARRKQKEEDEAYTRTLAKQADTFQQARSGMLSFLSSIEKDKQIKNGYIELTEAQGLELAKLVRKYPDYLSKLDVEHLTLTKIRDVISEINRSSRVVGEGAANQYNILSSQNLFAARQFAGTSAGQYVMKRAGALGIDTKNQDIIAAALELQQKGNAIDKIQAGLGGSNGVIEEYKRRLERQALLEPALANYIPKISRTSEGWAYKQMQELKIENEKPAAGPRVETSTSKEKPVDFVKVLAKGQNDLDKQLSDYAIKDWENYVGLIKDEMKDLQGKDPEGYDYARTELKAAFIEISTLKRNRLIDDYWAEVAGSIGAEYVPGNGTSAGTFRFIGDQAPTNRANYLSNAKKFEDQLKQRLGSFDQENASELNKNLAVSPDYKPPKMQHGSIMRDEKQIDKYLADQTRALTIEKDLARTGQQVYDIEKQITEENIKANDKKIELYTHEIERIKAIKITAENEHNVAQELENAKDRLAGFLALQTELNHKLDQQKETGFWENYQRGMFNATRAMGTTKDATIALGEGITNSLTNSIGGMVNALTQGGNAWKNFRSSLAQSLKDIAAEIQKYIVKLLALYAVQKLTGLLFSFKGNEFTGAQGVNVPQYGQSYAPVNPGIPVQFRAEGGLISGGIPGRDSVPAMLAPGEFVVKASSVAKYGTGALSAINQGRVRRFAEGGFVGSSGGSSSSSTASSDEVGITIINVVDPRMIQQARTGKQEVLNMIGSALDERHPVMTKLKMKMKE